MIQLGNKLGATKVEITEDNDMKQLEDFIEDSGLDPYRLICLCALAAGLDLAILRETTPGALVTGMTVGTPEYLKRTVEAGDLSGHDHFKHPQNHPGLSKDELLPED